MKLIYVVFSLLIFALKPVGAEAATYSVLENMDFGTLIIRNNDSSHVIRVRRNNNITTDPEIIPIVDPNRGRIRLEGLPASTAVTTTIPDTTLTAPSGRFFSITNFDPNNATSNGAGRATIRFGARLRTSGNGVRYISEPFNGTIDITLTW